jgi:hypothetical protein
MTATLRALVSDYVEHSRVHDQVPMLASRLDL